MSRKGPDSCIKHQWQELLLPSLGKFCPIPVVGWIEIWVILTGKQIWTERSKAAQEPKGTGSPCEELGHTGSHDGKRRRSRWPQRFARTGSQPNFFWQTDTHLLVQQPGQGSAGHKAGLGCSGSSVDTEWQGCHNKQLLPLPQCSSVFLGCWTTRITACCCAAPTHRQQEWTAKRETQTSWGTESKHDQMHPILSTRRQRVACTRVIGSWTRKKPIFQLNPGLSASEVGGEGLSGKNK